MKILYLFSKNIFFSELDFISQAFADQYWYLTMQNVLFLNFRKIRHDFELMAPTSPHFSINFQMLPYLVKICQFYMVIAMYMPEQNILGKFVP